MSCGPAMFLLQRAWPPSAFPLIVKSSTGEGSGAVQGSGEGQGSRGRWEVRSRVKGQGRVRWGGRSLSHSDGTPEADPCTFLTSPIVTLQHQAPYFPNIFEPCVSHELINIGVVLASNSPFPLSRLPEMRERENQPPQHSRCQSPPSLRA